MKIEKSWTVNFKSVRQGQVFEFLGNTYMCTLIIDFTGKTICNAVNLENGKYDIINADAQVSLYENAKVVLK